MDAMLFPSADTEGSDILFGTWSRTLMRILTDEISEEEYLGFFGVKKENTDDEKYFELVRTLVTTHSIPHAWANLSPDLRQDSRAIRMRGLLVIIQYLTDFLRGQNWEANQTTIRLALRLIQSNKSFYMASIED